MSNKLPNINPGETVADGFTYSNNAQVVGDDLYIRDSNGNKISGRSVSNGDKITVLDVGYTKQLVLVQYPAGSVVRQGYVTNATNLIKYTHQGEWHNGSTSETVYDAHDKILGSIDSYESATPLYSAGGKIHVVYNTDKGPNTKSGYVVYTGTPSTQSSTPEFVSQKLVDFIKSYEGFYPNVYDDGTGVKTIGYGTTESSKVSLGRCTKEQATKWLISEINTTAKIIKSDLDLNHIKLNQNQFDSLCSFAYNCGTNALLKESNLYKRICNGIRDESLRQNFLSWSHGNSEIMQGLVRRRNAECDMFLYSKYTNNI